MSDIRAEVLAWISEQEEFCLKATPGPWEMPFGPYVKSDGDGDNFSGGDWNVCPPLGHSGPVFIANSEENARAAAISRTALPLALAALRAEVERHECEPEWRETTEDWNDFKWAATLRCLCGDPWPSCATLARIHSSLGLK